MSFTELDLWLVELGKAYQNYEGYNLTDKDCREIYYLLKELKTNRKDAQDIGEVKNGN